MTGQINVNKIAARTGNTITINSGDKISGAAGSIAAPGQVVQVQTTATPLFTSATNTTLADLLSINFTPKFSDSLLRVDVCLRYQENGTDINLKYRVLNDSTNIYNVTNYSTYTGGSTNNIETVTFHAFVSAGSTSARDIKFQAAKVSSGGTFYVNVNATNGTRMTVTEIAQ